MYKFNIYVYELVQTTIILTVANLEIYQPTIIIIMSLYEDVNQYNITLTIKLLTI